MMTRNRSSNTWRDVTLIGCGIAALFALGFGVVVALNLDRVSEVVSTGKRELGSIFALRAKVIEEYGVADVQVNKSFSSAGEKISVEFANPSFLAEEEIDRETKAREIARFVLDHYEDEDLHAVQIVFSAKRSVGIVSVSNNDSHVFEVDELIGPSTESALPE